MSLNRPRTQGLNTFTFVRPRPCAGCGSHSSSGHIYAGIQVRTSVSIESIAALKCESQVPTHKMSYNGDHRTQFYWNETSDGDGDQPATQRTPGS